jgi:hypothetical protein
VFHTISVPVDSVIGDEQLGSKEKFWFAQGTERWLFKEGRANTGEDWAEKLAGELARTMDIQAARVELAEFAGRLGSASLSFVRDGENLVHGNEILAGVMVSYERDKRLHQSDHTLRNISDAVERLAGSEEAVEAMQILASYFVLDALICNTDRHHENWGFLVQFQEVAPSLRVAPSFDHASSLGRELQDERRLAILEQNAMQAYVRKGRGGIFLEASDSRGANPIHLIEYGIRNYPQYFQPAVAKIVARSKNQLLPLVDEIPADRISDTGRKFAKELLSCTHQILVELAS